MSTFMGGFVIAFVRGWLLALVLTSCIPAVLIAGGFMGLIMAKMSSRSQVAYAEAGNVVEQTIGAIRTVCHPYNNYAYLYLMGICNFMYLFSTVYILVFWLISLYL